MSKRILQFTRNINELMQKNLSPMTALDMLCSLIVNFIESDTIILDKDGKLVTEKRVNGNDFIFNTRQMDNGRYIDAQLNDQFKNIVEPTENINLNGFYIKNITKTDLQRYVAIIYPLTLASVRMGTLIFLKKDTREFSLEELCIAEAANMAASLVLSHSKNQQEAEESRKLNIVRSALGTLSYSELDAIIHIFEELDGSEGILIASKIADRVGITRSVIVNALRKFESAGVIETRSLGMKGTYIKVLNDALMTELNKLNG